MGAKFGHSVSQETKNKISQSLKGTVSNFKGKHHALKTIVIIKDARAKQVFSQESIDKRKIHMLGENHPNWTGDKVGYHALHKWVRQKLGKPNKCSNPNCIYPRMGKSGHVLYKPKKFCWANISKRYLRDITDWHSLCSSCNILDRMSPRVSPHKKETVSHWRSSLGVG